MKAIRGEYENGGIKLLEEVPDVKGKKVLVMFLNDEENEEEVIRGLSLLQTTTSFHDYLKDEREDLYQEYVNSK